MREQFSIIGFTEAELGFIAAILLFAVFQSRAPHAVEKPGPKVTSGSPALKPPAPQISISSEAAERLKQENSQLQLRIAALQRQIAESQRELDKKKKLQSGQKPSCIERGIAHSFIAVVQVAGGDRFDIEGEGYDLEGVRAHLSKELQEAKEGGCVQSVVVGPAKNITPEEYVIGRNRLGQYFYPKDSLGN
jgi:hypothetical protein